MTIGVPFLLRALPPDAVVFVSAAGDAAPDVSSPLAQLGIAGVALGALVALARGVLNKLANVAQQSLERERSRGDADRASVNAANEARIDSLEEQLTWALARGDRLEAENRELHKAQVDRVVPVLHGATEAVAALMRYLERERERRGDRQ